QENTAETLNANGAGATNGQLGVGAGTGNPVGATTPTTGYSKTSTKEQNAGVPTVTISNIPPGTVKRMSVSVLLDAAVVKPADVSSIWQPQILAAAGINT